MTEQGKAPAARTASHTPGPWRISETDYAYERRDGADDCTVRQISGANGELVCGTCDGCDSIREPDAKLIAAAPALADALADLVRFCAGLGVVNNATVAADTFLVPARAALRAAGLLGERSEPAEGRPSPETPAIPDSKG